MSIHFFLTTLYHFECRLIYCVIFYRNFFLIFWVSIYIIGVELLHIYKDWGNGTLFQANCKNKIYWSNISLVLLYKYITSSPNLQKLMDYLFQVQVPCGCGIETNKKYNERGLNQFFTSIWRYQTQHCLFIYFWF